MKAPALFLAAGGLAACAGLLRQLYNWSEWRAWPGRSRPTPGSDRHGPQRGGGPRLHGGGGAGQLQGAHCSSGCPGTPERPTLIVGAGISGMAAAHELRQMGCPVKVIEAKGHVGGRMHGEVQEGGWAFNHGANWIHGSYPNPIWALNQGNKILRTQWLPRTYYARTSSGEVVRDHGNDTYVPGRDLRDSFDSFTMNHSFFKEWLSLSCNGKFNSRDLPMTYFVEEYLRDRNASGKALDRFLLYYNVYETLDYAQDLFVVSMINKLVSSYNFDKEYFVADPYSLIVEHLAKDVDIDLNEPVSLIEYNDEGVLVRTRSGKTYNGTVAIVTVPVGVLQTADLSFQPPLPPWKQRTISGMTMGLLDKIFFVFDEPWWEKAGAEEDAFWTVKDGERTGFKTTASEWYNLHNLLNKSVPPVLLTTPGGYFADDLEFLPDEKVVGIFVSELQKIFPEAHVPRPRKMLRTFHRRDEFMRGSYFSPRVGTDPLSMKYLAEPVAQRLFFAGEATSTTRFGYVDGAYVTGQRAASEALELCRTPDWPLPMVREGLTAASPLEDDRIRREWRADVESVLEMSIPNCVTSAPST